MKGSEVIRLYFDEIRPCQSSHSVLPDLVRIICFSVILLCLWDFVLCAHRIMYMAYRSLPLIDGCFTVYCEIMCKDIKIHSLEFLLKYTFCIELKKNLSRNSAVLLVTNWSLIFTAIIVRCENLLPRDSIFIAVVLSPCVGVSAVISIFAKIPKKCFI